MSEHPAPPDMYRPGPAHPDPVATSPASPTRWGAPVALVSPADGLSTWGDVGGPVPPPVAARGAGDGPRLVAWPALAEDGPGAA